MQPINGLRHRFYYPWAIGTLAVILAGNRAALAAERPGPEAVEDLKMALRNVAIGKEERAARKTELETRINALHSVSDMRQGLALSEWRDGELPVKKGKVKRVAADTGEFVLTDQNGKDWTFGTLLASANLNKMRASTSWKPEDLKVGMEVIVNYKQGADRLEATDVGEEVVEDIDRPIRAELARRLTNVLRDQLQQGDISARLAALTVIGEMGIKVRGVGTNTSFARSFTADIADLLKSSTEAPVLRTGARVLGMIDPEPKTAVPALESLLDRDRALRQTAAEGLLGMMRTLRQLIKNDNDTTAQAKISKSAFLDQPIELVELGSTLVPAGVRGLVNDDFEVRRRCLEVIETAAVDLEAVVLKQLKPSEERRELMPLIEALNKAAPAVGKAASDRKGGSSAPAAAARLQAARTLEAIGITRQRLRGELPKLPRVPAAEATAIPRLHLIAAQAGALTAAAPLAPLDAKAPDLLATGMQGALPELESAVSDPDPQVRLAALDAIETYGPKAVGAKAGLVRALGDSNRYARWAAARILGKVDPAEAKEAVPRLARLLNDPALKQIEPDQDVRMNAAMTLERFGPVATAAAPALTRSISEGDAEEREKVIYARAAVGQAGKAVISALAGQLTHDDPRVRRAAAEALGRFASTAPAELKSKQPEVREAANEALSQLADRDTRSSLVEALDDEDADVRRAAADALASILSSPKGR